ncbi:FOG: Leucine rich repeat [Ceraceosorus bombacis]|uniref:FOG: Leucine rich repeat n=1 Tax=Ceraceosorus bombacis TaxID=401625 RepID=A0A0P1BH03_9BASI|nr:FOG: Leucine rich repeat [Ceraceosorus bombacis]
MSPSSYLSQLASPQSQLTPRPPGRASPTSRADDAEAEDEQETIEFVGSTSLYETHSASSGGHHFRDPSSLGGQSNVELSMSVETPNTSIHSSSAPPPPRARDKETSLGGTLLEDRSKTSAEPISDSECLTLVADLKAQSKRGVTTSGLATPSEGGISSLDIYTLDLCHKRIGNIPGEVVDLIGSDIIRLALGYNTITRLPDNFGQLNKLRYLNVRWNLITVFPACICELPVLEILDISRNKIRKLPAEPGRLLQLRILSIANNRLRKLPAWIAEMKNLRTLMIEANPITWPPPHISVMPTTPKTPYAVVRERAANATGCSASHLRAESGLSSAATSDTIAGDKTPKDDKAAADRSRKKSEEAKMVEWIGQVKSWLARHPEADEDRRLENALPSGSSRGLEAAMGFNMTSTPPPAERRMLLGTPQRSVYASTAQDTRAQPSQGADQGTARSADVEASAALLSDEETDHGEVLALNRSPPDFAPRQTPTATPAPASHETHTQQMMRAEDELSSSPARSIISTRRRRGTDEDATTGERNLISPPPDDFDDLEPPKVPPIPRHYSPLTSPAVEKGARPLNFESIDVGEPSFSGQRGRALFAESPLLGHGRNNSHSVAQATGNSQPRGPNRGSLLRGKKSLPELRTSGSSMIGMSSMTPDTTQAPGHAPPHEMEISASAPELTKTSGMNAVSDAVVGLQSRKTAVLGAGFQGRRPNLPQSISAATAAGLTSSRGHQPQHSTGSGGGGLRKLSLSTAATVGAADFDSPSDVRMGEGSGRRAEFQRPARAAQPLGSLQEDVRDAATGGGGVEEDDGAVEVERNSYFRRLSTLPPSTMSTSIPVAVPHLGAPEPSVIRAILIAARDSVRTFSKVVAVLQRQLQNLLPRADIRYTRTLLLMLYGSTAEVALAWSTMEPHVQAVLPYLARDEAPTTLPATHQSAVPPMSAPALLPAHLGSQPSSALPSIAEATSPVLQLSHTIRPAPTSAGHRGQRRRHAGSFSAHDVAQGATMGGHGLSEDQPFELSELRSQAQQEHRRRAASNAGSITPFHSLGTPASDDVLQQQQKEARGSSPSQSQRFPNIVPPYTANPALRSNLAGPGVPRSAPQAQNQGMSAPATSVRFPGYARSISDSPFSAGRNKRTPSNASASEAGGLYPLGRGPLTAPAPGGTAPPPATPVTSAPYPAALGYSANTPTPGSALDPQLVELVAEVTSVASAVWTTLLEHLASIGVRAAGLGPGSPGLPEPQGRVRGRLASGPDGASVEGKSSTDETASSSGASTSAGSSSRRLREVRELAMSSAELTRRLQATLDKVQQAAEDVEEEDLASEAGEARSPLPDSRGRGSALGFVDGRRLREESSRFVRAVISISTQIKATSVEHAFPKPIMRAVGELTTLSRDLTLHLHFNGPTGSTPSATPAAASLAPKSLEATG